MRLSIISSIKTNNFNDEHVMEKITEMWKEASSHLKMNAITTYGIYHNYESNYKGDYTLSVGIENNNGKTFIEIPENVKFEIYKVETSDEQGIFHTWRKIWNQEEAGTIERAYSIDYEKYYPNGKVEIYIAIK
ncbi:AraC family transcriptional regulator [Oceanobacillus piezotolerans]|uniref:AraC family transcriptional regulator n=1 Tax=Oceanobacillus piezotolerans TaxID=2448030 RepID=A0A498DAH9_9BACI|nr:AraC family transcriptional regulator [Oceanobacillus piezotolerans]RLL48343.1 AraC family transcriptional regulator [Oceanobacillus piezotolerans]